MTNDKVTALYCSLNASAPLPLKLRMESMMKYAIEQGYDNIEHYTEAYEPRMYDFERPAFYRLNTDIHAGKVDTVIVSTLKDIGQHPQDYRWIHLMRDKGINILSVDGSCDSNRLISDLIFNAIINIRNVDVSI
jgi:DNA invertase Pin-like site-specific DNA recombinase